MVLKCYLHKIAISKNQKEYAWYTLPNDTLPVMVHFSYLESTLIPFDETIEHSKNKSKGRVPSCDDTNVNTDQSLFGFEYFLERTSGVGYFMLNNQNYYRLSDSLSTRDIVDAFKYSGNMGNFVFI